MTVNPLEVRAIEIRAERQVRRNEAIRSLLPTGGEFTIEYRPVDYSSRTVTVRASVVEHNDGVVIVGVHPTLLAIPYDSIVLPYESVR